MFSTNFLSNDQFIWNCQVQPWNWYLQWKVCLNSVVEFALLVAPISNCKHYWGIFCYNIRFLVSKVTFYFMLSPKQYFRLFRVVLNVKFRLVSDRIYHLICLAFLFITAKCSPQIMMVVSLTVVHPGNLWPLIIIRVILFR